MKKIAIIFFLFIPLMSFAQKTIMMENLNGVYQIPCKVNNVPMNFVFDTGASDVTISLTETKFLIKQGLLNEEDFIEQINYKNADGTIKEGTQIILRKIEIEDIVLKDVPAIVIHEQNAPLLLGQTAIIKLGPYRIDKNKLILENYYDKEIYNKKEFDETFEWISKNIDKYLYQETDLETRYFFTNTLRSNNGGYLLSGLIYRTANGVKTEDIFMVPIEKIERIEFIESDENNYLISMLFKGEKGKHDFVISNTKVSSIFPIMLQKFGVENDDMEERFINAFNNLIKINQTFINEKF